MCLPYRFAAASLGSGGSLEEGELFMSSVSREWADWGSRVAKGLRCDITAADGASGGTDDTTGEKVGIRSEGWAEGEKQDTGRGGDSKRTHVGRG